MSESEGNLALQDLGVAAVAPPDGASHLVRLAELARELGANKVADEACDFGSHVAEGRLYVPVLVSSTAANPR